MFAVSFLSSLPEIKCLPLPTHAKLLRVTKDRSFTTFSSVKLAPSRIHPSLHRTIVHFISFIIRPYLRYLHIHSAATSQRGETSSGPARSPQASWFSFLGGGRIARSPPFPLALCLYLRVARRPSRHSFMMSISPARLSASANLTDPGLLVLGRGRQGLRRWHGGCNHFVSTERTKDRRMMPMPLPPPREVCGRAAIFISQLRVPEPRTTLRL